MPLPPMGVSGFWGRVEITPTCWLWTGTRTAKGYGRVRWNGRMTMAHIVAKSLLSGFPVDGSQHDHLCRETSCVNPTHLERVSSRENLMRGNTVAARNVAKTHCLRGHPLTEGNIYYRPDRPTNRACRACIALRDRKRKETRHR